MRSTCNLKKFDVNCRETVHFRTNLAENEIQIQNIDIGFGNRLFNDEFKATR